MTHSNEIFEAMAKITRETYSKNARINELSSCDLTMDGDEQEAGGPTPLDNNLATKKIVEKVRNSKKPFNGDLDTHVMMPIEVAKELAESHNQLMNLKDILNKLTN